MARLAGEFKFFGTTSKLWIKLYLHIICQPSSKYWRCKVHFKFISKKKVKTSVSTDYATSYKQTFHSTAWNASTFTCTYLIPSMSGCHKACTRQEEIHGDHQWFRRPQQRHWEVLLNILPFAGRKPQISGKFSPNYCICGQHNILWRRQFYYMRLSTCRPVWGWTILRHLDAVHLFIIQHALYQD